MSQTKLRPARANGTGLDVASSAARGISTTASSHLDQGPTPPLAALWLARRHRLSIETAVAIVTANSWGQQP